MRILSGVNEGTLQHMIDDIIEQTGTRHEPVDWKEPDSWIDQRLSGESAALANRIWAESDKAINPRFVKGIVRLIRSYDLVEIDSNGILQITKRGQSFLQAESETVDVIDRVEGLPQLMLIISSKMPAKRGDLLPEWTDLLLANSNYNTPGSIADALRYRLKNLMDRGLVSRESGYYSVTEQGQEYVSKLSMGPLEPIIAIQQSVEEHTRNIIAEMKERLSVMPFKEVELITGRLLEAMGYEDVEVTGRSGDMGVDVVAKVSFGITTFRELVQVKRRPKIQRSTIDQLKGALQYHDAIRGTVITTGTFARGCREVAEKGTPITLIDGDNLVKLMIKHGLGITKSRIDIPSIDDEFFQHPEEYE
jgi:restriction system protein